MPCVQSAAACMSRQGFEGDLRHWDITFWAERLREARYQLTDEQLRPYFALPNVLDGLFQARGRAGQGVRGPSKNPVKTLQILQRLLEHAERVGAECRHCCPMRSSRSRHYQQPEHRS